MRTNRLALREVACAVLLLVALPAAVLGQSIWLPPTHETSVSLEAFKADWSSGADVSFSSSVWFLNGRFAASPTATLTVDLPFSHFEGGGQSESAFGNPSVGVVFNPDGPAFAEAAVRLPLAPDDKRVAMVNGWYSDTDRWEAFLPDILTFHTRVGGRVVSESGNLLARLFGGPAVLIPTEDGDVEVLADLVGQLWLHADQFMLGTTLNSRTFLTQDDFDPFEDTEFLLGVGASGTFGSVQPGLHVHVPLLNNGMIRTSQFIDAVFGLSVTVFFGPAGPPE